MFKSVESFILVFYSSIVATVALLCPLSYLEKVRTSSVGTIWTLEGFGVSIHAPIKCPLSNLKVSSCNTEVHIQINLLLS